MKAAALVVVVVVVVVVQVPVDLMALFDGWTVDRMSAAEFLGAGLPANASGPFIEGD
jgi:hypothetical protein